jgi:hypothetical protein
LTKIINSKAAIEIVITMEDLPDEILNIIFNQTIAQGAFDQNIRFFRNACLVNKRWRFYAQSTLFNYWAGNGSNNHAQHILCFVRTLLDRPDLAKAVKTIGIGSFVSCITEQEPRCLLDSQLLQTMLETADRLRPGDEAWRAAISHTQTNAILAFVLFLLPKLNTLDLAVGFDELSTYWVMCFVRESIRVDYPEAYSPFLPNLHTIRSRNSEDIYGFDMWDIATLLNLPKLHTVEAWALSRCSAFAGNEWPVRNSKVKTLRLGFSELENSDFKRLLGSFEALEVLEWEWGPTLEAGDDITFSGIQNALQQHETSLKKLWLEVTGSYPESFPGYLRLDTLGPLANFKLLTNITISANFLIGGDPDEDFVPPHWEAEFPSGLEELNIVDIVSRLPQYLLHMANNCAGLFPKLRVVSCLDWDELELGIPRQVVCETFESAGVNFVDYKRVYDDFCVLTSLKSLD